MKNMSYALTTNQARAQVKDITRRLGWWNVKPGDLIQQVVKGMGLKKGEKIQKIHVIEVLEAKPEHLFCLTEYPNYGLLEVRREGFPNMIPSNFIDMFCKSHNGCTPTTEVNRIVFRYVDRRPECDCCKTDNWYIDSGDVIRCQFCRREFLSAFPQWAR